MSYKSKEFEMNRQPFAGNALFAAKPQSEIVAAVIKHAMTFKDQKV